MYLWIVYTGGAFAFIAAMGIGSNDAANAFATSVGSKALTLKQAAGLAIIFETAGAILMGNHVTDTIRKGIADYECFEDNPDILMYGCMWVMVSVSAWLFIASYFEMPVSTTHSCVGGMIGMTITLAGPDCVIWYKEVDSFPYIGGVGGIVLSWVISPIFSGILASLLYAFIRSFVLRHAYNSKRIIYSYPILVGGTILINSFFIIYKGAKGIGLDEIDIGTAIGYSFAIAGGGALVTVPLVPIIRKRVNKKFLHQITTTSDIEMITNNRVELNIYSENQLSTVVDIHNKAEKFDPKIEETFKYLQIFSAICDSFSHGANDVANAIGPFAAIYTIYNSGGDLSKKLDMGNDAYWILAIGGVGIAIGLVVYGKKIINAIGSKLCKITPSRGTCIELGSALVIITGSRLKIPLSTTHCQVGATVGVGLLENKSCHNIKRLDIHGVNWYILGKTAFGWIITCVVVGVTTGILVAQGVYSPPVVSVIDYYLNKTIT
jgi:solute carrier family 20 (sodium-dependent phosphate transporter)